MNKNRKTLSIVSYILGIVLLLFLTSLLFNMNQEEVTKLKYYEVLETRSRAIPSTLAQAHLKRR